MSKLFIMTKHEILQQEIVNLSEASDWEVAKQQWWLSNIYFLENSKCLCTHSPITECCELVNFVNHNRVVVGNCCVKKFWNLDNSSLFSAAKRIKQDNAKSANKELIEMAFDNHWITNWEGDFYLDTLNKRKLSPKQKEVRQRINDKILIKLNKRAK